MFSKTQKILDWTRGDTPERSSDLLLLYPFLNNTDNNINSIQDLVIN